MIRGAAEYSNAAKLTGCDQATAGAGSRLQCVVSWTMDGEGMLSVHWQDMLSPTGNA